MLLNVVVNGQSLTRALATVDAAVAGKNKSANKKKHGQKKSAQDSVYQGKGDNPSLDKAIDKKMSDQGSSTGLIKELSYGTLRWYFQLDAIVSSLLSKPLKKKDQDVRLLLLMGIYQLKFLSISDHAVLAETVEVAREIKKDWATGLVNAILRNFQRNRESIEAELEDNDVAIYSHPRWLIKQIKSCWSDSWAEILQQNNEHPPLCLRVNRLKQNRDDYLARLSELGIEATPVLHSDDGVLVHKPVPVDQLPGFSAGEVSVQDAAAQLAAGLLELAPEQKVLDACAAPGGKSCHIIETRPQIGELVALDVENARLVKLRENLTRLGFLKDGFLKEGYLKEGADKNGLPEKLKITVLQGDVSDPQRSWWDGEMFDRILLDAPCSATGVIRRHPDIKLLRLDKDIKQLVEMQQKMLEILWHTLKPGGILLYATCSVLAAENHLQVAEFLSQHPDAKEKLIEASWGRKCTVGRQILPGEVNMDGFYYACLVKLPE